MNSPFNALGVATDEAGMDIQIATQLLGKVQRDVCDLARCIAEAQQSIDRSKFQLRLMQQRQRKENAASDLPDAA